MRYSVSYDRELCAGEMFVPAGYRPAEAFVRAGGLAARPSTFYMGILPAALLQIPADMLK